MERNGLVPKGLASDKEFQRSSHFRAHSRHPENYTTDTTINSTSEDFYVLDKVEWIKYDSLVPLESLQKIPVYNERAKNLDGGNVFKFTYPNWRRDPAPTFESRYGNTISSITPSTINYDTGTITLNSDVLSGTEIFADYQFKFFSHDTVIASVDDAVNWMNMYGRLSYTPTNYPDFWYPTIKSYVVCDLIENIQSSILFREKRLIFSEEGVTDILRSLYESNKEQMEIGAKKARLPSDFRPRVMTGGDVMLPYRVTSNSYFVYSASYIHR